MNDLLAWQEGDELWRGLRARFPNDIARHRKEQDFYFSDDFLLRRHDYDVVWRLLSDGVFTILWRWMLSD